MYCPAPGQVDRVCLELVEGATLADALQASGLLQRHALSGQDLRVGVWGREQPPGAALRAFDRVELYRPLRVDPKEARRQRYKGRRGGKLSDSPTR